MLRVSPRDDGAAGAGRVHHVTEQRAKKADKIWFPEQICLFFTISEAALARTNQRTGPHARR